MSEIRKFFEKDIPPLRLKASQPLICYLEKECLESGKPLFDFLEKKIHHLKSLIDHKHLTFSIFEKKFQETSSQEALRLITLDFAKELGASAHELKKDKKAFSRWFDFNAVADRCRHQISWLESELGFIIDRFALLMLHDPSHPRASFLMLTTDWAQTYPGNKRIKVVALDAIIKLLTPDISLDSEVFHYLSLSDQKDVWVQCNAISILKYLNPDQFKEVATKRLKSYLPDPDLFVRHHIVTLLDREDSALLTSILGDPSDFVRQALCQKINFLSPDVFSRLLEDSSPQVRALAILNLIATGSFEERCARLKDMCTHESDPFVLRTCLRCITNGFQPLSLKEKKEWLNIFEPILDHLHAFSADIPTRRRAAQAREELWCEKNLSLFEIKEKVNSLLINIKPGNQVFVPSSLFMGLKEEEVGRLFSLMTQLDFGCELKKTKKGYKIFRGVRFGFRLWRFLYEFLHPKTEKRESVRHTLGRHFHAEIQAPSSILAELSQTQVPGEPLYIHEEGGYRPYLPLLDHMLSIAQKGRPFSFYTSEGITRVSPPHGFLKCLRAKARITFHFSSFAELRNWRKDSYWEPSRYVKTLEALGFKFHFHPYDDKAPQDPMVARFFAGALFFPDLDTFLSYVLTTSKTSVLGLSVCVTFFCILFFWRYMRAYHIIKKARDGLPLVIGGWGTRGKSSTDRLKGALINRVGLGVFAKTTGCEAIVGYAGPYQKLHEILFYRPYRKVTIWEQMQATLLAGKLKTDAMLWECMALKSEYVEIMQQQWMRSDLSTLTNAYPDHEDVQGPAGYNIVEAQRSFIVPKGHLLTAEEQMLPYLQADAFEKKAKINSIGWLEEGLLTNDILDRFPYKEHTQNIALVLEIAKYFNVSIPVALKEMADEVLPDIGALKVYPTASVNSRSLQFINGMSANEEYGCLTNWYRLGLDEVPPLGTWISTFINNREDRVARSRVFAKLLVHKLNADQYFVVGTNINGFMGFLTKDWADFLSHLPYSSNPEKLLEKLSHKLRICSTTEDLKARLFAMGAKGFEGDIFDLHSLEDFMKKQNHPEPKVLLRFHQKNIKMFQEYSSLYKQLLTNPNVSAFKETLTSWFMSKFIFPVKTDLSGDEMISWVCEHTPPYYLNKIMGIQNIKGPGLEFVYRWQAWEKCYDAGKLLFSPIPQNVLQGFRKLMELHEFGLLSQEYLKELFSKSAPKYETEIRHLKTHIEKVKQEQKIKRGTKKHILIKLFASLFDINVAYHRTNKVNKIYQDLGDHRISYFRANEELKKFEMQNE